MLKIRIAIHLSQLAIILLLLITLDVVDSFVFKRDYHTIIFLFALFGVMLLYIVLKSSKFILMINYKSIIFMSLLCLWIASRSLMDTGDVDYATNFLFKTNSGIILFFMMGVFYNIASRDYLLSGKNSLGKSKLLFVLLLYLSLVIVFGYWILSLIDGVVAWAFIVSLDLREGYQRVSDFISILFIIISLLAGHIWLHRRILLAYRLVLIALYTVVTLEFLLFFVLIGANKQSLLVISVFLLNIALFIFVKTRESLNAIGNFHRNVEILANSAFYKFIIKRILAPFVAMILAATALVALYVTDLPNIRLLNAGPEGAYGSLVGRIEGIKTNYLEHLSYAPIFGNVIVDELTTGDGSYVHSLLLYTSAHLGFFGLFILFAFIVISIFTRIHVQYRRAANTADLYSAYFNVFSFLIVFLIANISTFTYWSVFWFVLGASFPVIRFLDRLNLFPQKQLSTKI